MALLKPKDIRAMRTEDIRSKMKELSDELMHERGVAAMGGAPASPGKIRALRMNIARIHTIQRELQLAEALKTPPKAPAKEANAVAKKPGAKPKEKKQKAEKAKKEEKK